MKRVIYCKYNQNRASRFQTKTKICQTENKLFIEKQALTEKAIVHVKSFRKNYESVKNIYPKIELIPCQMNEEIVHYPFIKGKNIDKLLKENVSSWDGLFVFLKNIIDDLFLVNPENKCHFEMTEGFIELFGNVDCANDICIQPCNLDMIFDNLIFTEDHEKVKAFDYEWVCDFPVPEKYVIYRVLCRFYDKYFGYISAKYSFDKYIEKFDFSQEEQIRYRKMEDAFINYIYTDGEPAFQAEQYFLNRITFKDIISMQSNYKGMEEGLTHAVEDYNRVIEVLHNTEKEYLITIERLNEAARLKMEGDKTILEQLEKIRNMDQLLEEKLRMIKERDSFIEERESVIEEKENNIKEKNIQIETLQKLYDEIINSKSWKITKPLRFIMRGIKCIKTNGFKISVRKLKTKMYRLCDIENEEVSNEDLDKREHDLLSMIEVEKGILELQKNKKFVKQYKISIITPLFNTPINFLVEMLESVKNQTYSNWEHCLVNFSTDNFEAIDEICKKYAEDDKRILYYSEVANKGIAENTNRCISFATGEYAGLLDHDDILHPSALYEVMKAINDYDADFIYTDEVKFSNGIKDVFSPNFKPDFSADELRAHNYICHLNVFRLSLYHKVGGYNSAFDGSQDHDMVMRLTEKAKSIIHIPKILYYWRVHSNSVAKSIEVKSYATDAGANAVTEQFKRLGEQQYAESVINHIPLYRFWATMEEEPDVTVIIWGGSKEQSLKSRESLKEMKNADCIIIEGDEKIFGEKCFDVMKTIKTKYVLFLLAGLQVTSNSIVNEFMIYKNRNDVATIDCKVLTDINTIFSGGAYLSGDSGMPVKLRCMGGPRTYAGYENGMLHSRNVTVSAGLCTFVNVELWNKTVQMNNKDSEYSILKYSYEIWKNGKKNIWTPFIEAVGMTTEHQQRYLTYLLELAKNEFSKRDIYFSEHILELKLE